MKIFIVLVAALLAVNALPAHQEHWTLFKAQHGKSYESLHEEKLRFQIFQTNLETINKHNARYEAGLETYYMGVNKFADMTPKEFSAMLRLQNGPRPKTFGSLHVSSGSAPDRVDWRESGLVREVKDQGTCGSCWAFSATGAIEAQSAKLFNKSLSLSEQELLDCSGSYGNGNCKQGGTMINAFKYVIDHGISTESAYPYENELKECRAPKEKADVTVKSYKQVEKTEEALKDAVATIGPISVAIFAEPIQFYFGGIFKNPLCLNFELLLDHGVLVVGYESDPEPYWIVKNSWGAEWGENGYFRLARDASQCGIALDTCYPVL